MKVFDKFHITTALLAFGVISSFAGALASSLAWYAYSVQATLGYYGTTVAQTEQLQLGIKTDLEFPDWLVEEYGITYYSVEDTRYAFLAPGTSLNSDVLMYYLSYTGYGSNALVPVTSKRFQEDDDLSLYQYHFSQEYTTEDEAYITSYCYIPFAFRVVKFDGNGLNCIKNQNIWLSDAAVEAPASEGNVYKAVRVNFTSDKVKFIFNPSAEEAGGTVVSGLLDMNCDGYYDHTGYEEGGTEIIYGDYEGTASTTYFVNDSPTLDDVNGTGNESENTTFTAKHMGGINCYTKDQLDLLTRYTADYLSLNDIAPEQDAFGFLSGGRVLCTTSDDEYAIANLDATVYLEGWDFSVIDQEIDHYFNLGLTFQINKIS